MLTLLNFLKKMPIWFWVALAVAIILSWQALSGFAMSRKLYKMALDNLREDQSNVIQSKEEWIKTCEAEITRLQGDKERLQKEKANIQKQAIESATEVARLKGRIGELQTALQNVTVSDDPDVILDDLRKLGIRSIRKSPDEEIRRSP